MSNEESAEAGAEEEDAVEDEATESATTEDEATEEETAEDEAEETTEDADAEKEEAAEDAEDETEEEPEGVQDGDFVRLAYTARTVDDGNLVDTTDVEVAEEEGIDTEGQTIEPRVIVVGARHVFPAVEGDLIGKEAGDTGSVTVSAADAFGEYDPDQVRTISADRIPEDDRYPGGHVDVDGQHGHVETIIGGRARVDFNHVLAGEDVEYDYEILEVVEDTLDRARGLLGTYLDLDLDMHVETDEVEQTVYDEGGEEEEGDEVEGEREEAEEKEEDDEAEEETEDGEVEERTETVELETLYVEATPMLSMNQQWLFQKTQIAQELIERVGIDRVVVQEVLDGSGGLGGLGGIGGPGGAVGGADLEDVDLEDVDAEELVEELAGETDFEADTDDVEE